MKVFTDRTEMSFFKTDKYIKDLRPIEINNIKDWVVRYGLDPMILFGDTAWMVGRFDELTPGKPIIDSSEEPELHGEWLDIDFVAAMRPLDILFDIGQSVDWLNLFFEALCNERVFSKAVLDDSNESFDRWTFSAHGDPRRLIITSHIDGSESFVFESTTEDKA